MYLMVPPWWDSVASETNGTPSNRHQHQSGRHSGIATKFQPYGWVFTVRGGKIVRTRWYPDQESALEAAGLRE
jgi:hypothetical protein